jgi:DNA-binding MarR family transcriptional regulator
MPLEEAEFQMLRDTVGISDSVLSKQITLLEEAGYVGVRKGAMNGRQRTWARLTGKGRRAFNEHVAALQKIAALAKR